MGSSELNTLGCRRRCTSLSTLVLAILALTVFMTWITFCFNP